MPLGAALGRSLGQTAGVALGLLAVGLASGLVLAPVPAAAEGPPADAFMAAPGLFVVAETGMVHNDAGAIVSRLGPDWEQAEVNALALKYSLLSALSLREDGRVSVDTEDGRRAYTDGEQFTTVFTAERRGETLLMALDADGRLLSLGGNDQIVPGWTLTSTLQVVAPYGEAHLVLIVGHGLDRLAAVASRASGRAVDTATVVSILGALADGSVATLAILTAP